MPAYMVILARVKDRARFLEAYAQPTAALVARMGGRYVVRAPGAVPLEGGFGDDVSVVISEWPDKAAIDRFWTSPDYAPLKAARQSLADVDVLVVEQP
ncbi:MAG: DUF1330 domain-containing protein [Alphaproteobacteria bacterium]|nr:DUF1330 domain-containing protein [Alphaproteobacteria bacterium]